ncbi:MAG: ABC transporter ATP-binding protein [Propionibacteriaceae bacterium]|jgi:putative ABC transport system ATP-binding protein|nr:ABC transporter ATP-binding protein [Propionibacteriaceae bacterium]
MGVAGRHHPLADSRDGWFQRGGAAQPVLDASGLSRVFPGPVPVVALKEASLRVDAGEVVAITGRSGSGKSTLLNLLGLLDTPTAGSLAVAGHQAAALGEGPRARLRASTIGFVFQAFHLVGELTALQNVMVPLLYQGLSAAGRRRVAAEALEGLGMGARLNALASTLSGGEKQRVALARASAHRPAVILADEPTGNLDAESEDAVLKLLVGLSQSGSAILLVTHNPAVAAAAHTRYRMEDGVLAPQDPEGGATRDGRTAEGGSMHHGAAGSGTAGGGTAISATRDAGAGYGGTGHGGSIYGGTGHGGSVYGATRDAGSVYGGTAGGGSAISAMRDAGTAEGGNAVAGWGRPRW